MKPVTGRKSPLENLSLFGVWLCLLTLLFSLTSTATANRHNDAESVEELRQQLREIRNKLDELDKGVSQNSDAVEAISEEVEERGDKPSVFDRMSIGGYGELHYNNYDAEESQHDKDELDFHRFVLFFGYEFRDDLRFFSEFEIEHALSGDGKPGEVELEQAFVEYDFDDNSAGRVGVFLLPVGILNETHEPPTFYGVERNTVENVIIPSTWWAGGVGYTRRWDNGFSFDLAVHEGLKIDSDDGTARIRSGRQKTAEADADDLAGTARLKYTGIPGLELAASFQYQSDISQESGDNIDDAYLSEFHVAYSHRAFGLRALYARWDIDTDDVTTTTVDPATMEETETVGDPVKDADYDEQEGWYIEPSYKITNDFGVFARYEDVEGGRSRDEFDQWVVGFNYWVHENVVLKADYMDREHDNDSDEPRDFDGFNLGFGYQF